MSMFLRRLAAMALTGLAAVLPAQATPHSTDYSDLWWAGTTEDGWGVNVVQQGDVLFATFFVYGTDSAARWFVAPAMAPTAAQPSTGSRFSGNLYQTTGPWFGGPFNPSQVTASVVGGASANRGTFTMTGLDAQRNGFHATFTGTDQFCTYNGRFGGTREAAG